MKMQINEFAKLTGVSVRTLHYYDEIGLLKPAFVDEQNGYRFYDESSLLRMQEILFYRELDFSLKSISEISSDLVPVIHVQAKNKSGIDYNDIEGAFQLVRTEGYAKQINILINTTQEFSYEAKKYAAEKGIILINGFDFASLLVKYGIDTDILE